MLKSIAFIPDGNRRYSRTNRISLMKAYDIGIERAKEAIGWSFEQPNLKEATVWTLSTENLQRNSLELGIFLRLLGKKLEILLNEDIVPGKDVRIRVLGQLEKIPRGLRNLSLDIMRKTEDYTDYTFNLMLGYGGRYELVQAVNKLIAKGKPVTVDNFSQALYLTSEPDLIVRTGDTHRLSGFMPWQSTYSELYFTKQLWPEFTKADFEDAINEFHARSRTFGV